MTPFERLRRARRRLVIAVVLEAAACAIALGVLVAALLRSAPMLAAVVAFITFAAMLWRRRALQSIQAVALWVEERQPALEYALVTAADSGVAAGGVSPSLSDLASAAEIEPMVARATRRLLGRGLVAALVAVSAWAVIRHAGTMFDDTPRPANSTVTEAPNRLTPLAARVESPAYAHLPVVDVKEPATVEGLVGGTVTLTGRGTPGGVTAFLGNDSLAARPAGPGWASGFRMPAAPGVVTLRDRAYRRLIVLVPRPDSIPQVVLSAPAHDTTYQTTPSEPIPLEARATDDIGLAIGYFEYLISSGTGEHFETVTRTSPHVALGLRPSAVLRATLRLDTLKLTPGSVVNIRAIALDANDVTGPGKGVSETRTIRLAEPRDSVSVAPAPPDQIDSMLISQRLLNLRTDTLLRTRGRLTRAAVADRSMSYSNVQESIRLRVVAVVALLEDDGVGGTAPTEVSTLLRSAGLEMQAARIDLATAAPDSAMPHMRRALAILDQVRNAHRYYLRGRTPPVLVDIERVRLQGRTPLAPTPRAPRERLDDPDALLAGRIEKAARLYPSAREAALDSLTFIRVAALEPHPDLAGALARAIDRLRAGDPLDPTLAPVRRLSSRPAEPLSGPPEWLGSAP